VRSVSQLVIAASSLVLYFEQSNVLIAAHAQQEVCDLDADYFVGAKDEAIRGHTEMVRVHPLDWAGSLSSWICAQRTVGDKNAGRREYRIAPNCRPMEERQWKQISIRGKPMTGVTDRLK
jgi:hypothetical protein